MSITVLMYHHILPKSGFIATSTNDFELQMSFLKQNGYYTVSSNEFLAYKKGEITLPKKSVLITFDDGWRDNFYYAYPILKRYNLRATIFLVTGWIEAASNQRANFTPLYHNDAKIAAPLRPGEVFLNWSEIEEMSAQIDFHSHTHEHTDGYFHKMGFKDDLIACRQTIKKRLGFDDLHLCWPRGKFDEDKLNIAKNIGYQVFYTTHRGINSPDNKLDKIKRIAVKNGEKWLRKTLFIYNNDILGKVYSKIKK